MRKKQSTLYHCVHTIIDCKLVADSAETFTFGFHKYIQWQGKTFLETHGQNDINQRAEEIEIFLTTYNICEFSVDL
jgi:hypothetical protein